MEKKPNIDDLLHSLRNPNKKVEGITLENNQHTWTRIGERDAFLELGLEPSALDAFLKQWVEENPYSNI